MSNKQIPNWIWQALALVFALFLFGSGFWITVLGLLKETSPETTGAGLVLLVSGATMMAMAGLVVSVASKLTRE